MIYSSTVQAGDIPDVDFTTFTFAAARDRGDKPAIIEGATGRTITYRELERSIRTSASAPSRSSTRSPSHHRGGSSGGFSRNASARSATRKRESQPAVGNGVGQIDPRFEVAVDELTLR
jgi:hypothetical protein